MPGTSDGTSSPRRYVVQQGDYLTKLAHRFGVSATEAWNLPENGSLRSCRENMDMLAPGDVIYIPNVPRKWLTLSAGGSNAYVAAPPNIMVHLVFTVEDQPIANEPYEVRGLNEPVTGTTGSDGSVSFLVPVHTPKVDVFLSKRNQIYPVMVGHLDPPTERSGAEQRLLNMGYFGRHATSIGEDDALFVRGLIAFQTDNADAHALSPTGELDDATVKALKAVHGS